MSGSSLDGLDLALCEFSGYGFKVDWKILDSKTIPFTNDWIKRLKNLPEASAKVLAQTDFDLGYYIGEMCSQFLGQRKIDYISSHGHTVFHYPKHKSTCQIGNGAAIAARSGFPVICDFRSSDIAYGGQGAPIVSIMDQHLFSEYNLLINLGGIANITINDTDNTKGFDICPCNQLLNYLAGQAGKAYDENGGIAAKGVVIPELRDKLLSTDYLSGSSPKTLDNSYIRQIYFPIVDAISAGIQDKLRTAVAFIVDAVHKSLSMPAEGSRTFRPKILLTGGGVKNNFLITELGREMPDFEWIVPASELIDFKEALLMAFLGYLRINKIPNVKASVTGAMKDTLNGAIYWP
jgi:anhydro-N-acetylmuramic acid kinase